MHNLELKEVLLMEAHMERFLSILRFRIWESHLVYNLELREVLMMEDQMGRLLARLGV